MVAAAAIGGVLLSGGAVAAPAFVATSSDVAPGEPTVAAPVDGEASRSGDRPALSGVDAADQAAADRAEGAAEKALKVAAKADEEAQKAAVKRRALEQAQQNPRGVAEAMVAEYGWGPEQFSCLDTLWTGESGWDHTATNPSSGAYGIPQSLPATKMASAGQDWKTNPVTQIRWGLDYIRDAYGTPCAAQGFKSGNGFY